MAVDTLGDKNEPQFLDTGAPDIGVDPTAVAAYAAKYGNHRVGTTSERTSEAVVWDGLEWYDTTLQKAFLYQDGWHSVESLTATVLTVGSGITLPAGVTETSGRATTKVWKERGIVFLEGCLTTTAGVGFGFLNLPSGYWPPGTVRIWCDQGGFAEITSTGVVSTGSSGARTAIGFSGHFHL